MILAIIFFAATATASPLLRNRAVAFRSGSTLLHPLLLKTYIAQCAKETNGGATATPAERAEMSALVSMLEESAATKPWDCSQLACGTWEQCYTDNPRGGVVAADGYSSKRKLIGPIKGTITQCVECTVPSPITAPAPRMQYGVGAGARCLSAFAPARRHRLHGQRAQMRCIAIVVVGPQ